MRRAIEDGVCKAQGQVGIATQHLELCPVEVDGRLKSAVRDQFELTPQIVVVETGSLAKEFEASVKMPRFSDRRQ